MSHHTHPADALSALCGHVHDNPVSSAGSRRASAAALMEQAQPRARPSESAVLSHWTHQPPQQQDMPLPHRNRDPIRSAFRKLFGRQKPTGVLSNIAPSPQEQVSHCMCTYANFVRHSDILGSTFVGVSLELCLQLTKATTSLCHIIPHGNRTCVQTGVQCLA